MNAGFRLGGDQSVRPACRLKNNQQGQPMRINRDNYPLYFLDHFEGRLPREVREELWRFLDQHPDLKEEFNRFDPLYLEADQDIAYPDRDALKKGPATVPAGEADDPGLQTGDLPPLFSTSPGDQRLLVNPGAYELAFAAYVEGDLGGPEKEAVERFVADRPALAKELRTMSATRLQADPSERYPAKAALKRPLMGVAHRAAADQGTKGAGKVAVTISLFRKRLIYATSAAAAVALLAMVTFTLFPWREEPLTATHEGIYPHEETEERPVEGVVEHPGAVAEAPAPQQERTPHPGGADQRETASHEEVASHREAAITPSQPLSPLRAELPPGELPAPGQAAAADDRAAPKMDYHDTPYIRASILPGRISLARSTPAPMERVQPAALDYIAETRPAGPEERSEFYWLAYADRPPLFSDEPGEETRRELSLGALARQQIEGITGIDVEELGHLAAADEGILRRVAGRGLGGLNRALGEPVVVDGETNAEGRKVQFAIGNLIEISRSGPSSGR